LKNSRLPNVALIREIGTSGAYLAATGADTIYASPFSDVGGIGITMSYLDNSQKNSFEGLQYQELTSAPFKDYGSPDKPLTEAERALFQRDLAEYHNTFVAQVASNRNISTTEVERLADGSALPGTLALEEGLIDHLGNQESTRSWFAEQLGIDQSEVIFCE